MALPKSEITRLRDLHRKKHRETAELFAIEGTKVVGELLAAGHQFTELYATEAWAAPPGTPVRRITPGEMARISHYPTPSPVLAVGRIVRPRLDAGELAAGHTLALDDIQDPGNVGTLIRLADWFGLDRVLLSPGCADLYSQKVLNATMGSFARVRVISTELPGALAKPGVPVLGCDLNGEAWHEVDPPPAAVVVIGNEGRGLSPAVAATITRRITIPSRGGAESLNAAVAAGIICAHLRR